MECNYKKALLKILLVFGVIILIAQYGIACYVYLDNFHMTKIFSDVTEIGHEISIYQKGKPDKIAPSDTFIIYIDGRKIIKLEQIAVKNPIENRICCLTDDTEVYEIDLYQKSEEADIIFSSDFSAIKYISAISFKIYDENMSVEKIVSQDAFG